MPRTQALNMDQSRKLIKMGPPNQMNYLAVKELELIKTDTRSISQVDRYGMKAGKWGMIEYLV